MTPKVFTARRAAQTRTYSAKKHIGLASLLLITVFVLFAGRANAYSQIVAFGDSLSDTGNVLIGSGGALPFAPYVDGRFSNGPVWLETVAAFYGVPLDASGFDPSAAAGTNYAVGGTPTGNPLTSTFGTMLENQLPLYLAHTSGVADPSALYSVFGGGNDVRLGNPAFAAANVATIVADLYAAGARNFIVPNLPDVGLTPEATEGGPGTSVPASLASQCINFGGDPCELLGLPALDGLDDYFGPGGSVSSLPGINVTLLDVFGFVNDIVADPAAFGFTDVSNPCWTGTTGVGGPPAPCANPDDFLFWDGIHPTAAANALLGNEAIAQLIPVPAAVWLFGSALGLLGWVRRKAA